MRNRIMYSYHNKIKHQIKNKELVRYKYLDNNKGIPMFVAAF